MYYEREQGSRGAGEQGSKSPELTLGVKRIFHRYIDSCVFGNFKTGVVEFWHTSGDRNSRISRNPKTVLGNPKYISM
jgi:hypothetical protein